MGTSDLAPVFTAVWVAGVIRVGLALVDREMFGTELTLVVLTVVLIPVLLFSSRLTRAS